MSAPHGHRRRGQEAWRRVSEKGARERLGVRVCDSHIYTVEGYRVELGLLGLKNFGSRPYKPSASENLFTETDLLKAFAFKNRRFLVVVILNVRLY